MVSEKKIFENVNARTDGRTHTCMDTGSSTILKAHHEPSAHLDKVFFFFFFFFCFFFFCFLCVFFFFCLFFITINRYNGHVGHVSGL